MISKLFSRLMAPVTFSTWAADVAIAIPRILCGLLLTIDFGASKFGMPWTPADRELALFEVVDWFPEDVAQFGVPFSLAPVLFAWLGAASEAIGGLFLALGFQTRIAAFFIAGTMLTAIFFQKWGEGTWGMLPAMGFLWVSVYAMVLGSGRIGLDHWVLRFFKRKAILPSVLLLVLAVGFSNCSSSFATITIPAKQEFVLGELEKNRFRAELKNLSDETVQVKAVLTETGEQTQGFGLAANGKATVNISRREQVLLINEHDKAVRVKAKLNKGVAGMRYRTVNR